MRRWLAIPLLLLAGLIAVLAVNLLRYGQAQPQPAPVDAVTAADRAAADLLARAIRFRTVSHADRSRMDREAFLAFQGFLGDAFPRVHEALRLERVNELSLLYTWPGAEPGRSPLLLTAHYDVVPVEPGTAAQWRHPPFAGRVVDGTVWGRGALDDKVGVIALLQAVETLLAQGFQPARPVMIAIGHDEEVGGQEGARRIAALLEDRGVRIPWMIDEGGIIAEGMMPGVEAPVALVQIAEKGYVTFSLTAEAQGGHSSMPPRNTAVGILGSALHRLERNPMPTRVTPPVDALFAYTAPHMPLVQRTAVANRWLLSGLLIPQLTSSPQGNAMVRTTLAPTVMRAGVKDNVLPARARALVNARLLPGATPDAVLDHVRSVIDDDRVKVELREGYEAPPVARVDAPGFRDIAGVVRGQFPEAVVAPSLLVATTDSRHYRDVVRDIYRFRPTRLDAERLETIHGRDERISVESVAQTTAFYRHLLREAASDG
ncbi:M20/M25/M40 family metallo-hydrolase [Ectothiorhodospiraceae bacterium WFHF3C12]|nr:M20/M25/M40 family metallo-hydrolase [Ectothiorhodospiraceae bacterium WFHF3C12]